jgi:predicted MFS family arabinose efflux permease
MTEAARSSWPPILAGASATLLGVGLQRFAYGPLLPAMIEQGWLPVGPAGMLGGANLAGYLAGAFAAGMMARALGLVRALRLCMLTAALGFALCAVKGGFFWFLPWRVLAGFTGGVLMVLAGPAVQAVAPASMRGVASGAVITGVGVGIVIGALLVPALLPFGLAAAWLALAAAALVLTALSWTIWPDAPAPPPAPRGGPPLPNGAALLIVVYGLAGLAATAHMVFWPDFIARGLGLGAKAGGLAWLGFGAAAALGAALFGRLGDRIGARRAMAAGLLTQALSLALPLIDQGPLALGVSTAGAGLTLLGVTALALVRSREIGGEAGPRIWRLATAVWGTTTAAAGFLLSWILAAAESHLPLFALCLAAALAAIIALAAPSKAAPSSP